jgi:hypothetical protein
VENDLLAYAAGSKDAVQVCCVKPGLIMGPDFDEARFLSNSPNAATIPKIKLEECVAATLKQAIEGIQMEPIGNDELAEIGRDYIEKTT